MVYEDKAFHVRYDPTEHGPADFLKTIEEMNKFKPSVFGAIRAEIEGASLTIAGTADDAEVAAGAGSSLTVTLTPAEDESVGSEKEPTTLAVEAPDGLSAEAKPASLGEPIVDETEVEVAVQVAKGASPGWHTIPVKVTFHTKAGDESSTKHEVTVSVPVLVVEASDD